MSEKPTRVFAIQLGPQWAELRTAEKAPKMLVSRVERTVVLKKYRYATCQYIEHPEKYTLKVVAHEGGERLCVLPLGQLKRMLTFAGYGGENKLKWKRGMIEVPKPVVDKVLDPKWRRDHAKPYTDGRYRSHRG